MVPFFSFRNWNNSDCFTREIVHSIAGNYLYAFKSDGIMIKFIFRIVVGNNIEKTGAKNKNKYLRIEHLIIVTKYFRHFLTDYEHFNISLK